MINLDLLNVLNDRGNYDGVHRKMHENKNSLLFCGQILKLKRKIIVFKI